MAVTLIEDIPEPVTLDEVKAQCRVSSLTEDTLMTSLIKAARSYVEELCGPLITQQWEEYFDNWPSGDTIYLSKQRLQSVDYITYTDEDEVVNTLSATDYTVDTKDSYRPRIVLKEDSSWPTDSLFNVNPIIVRFVCGYGDATTDVPEPIRLAILMLIAHWFENREATIVGQTVITVPYAVDCLLANYRQWGF